METLTRLVTESLARHGFDRPLDYRRLQWSRWFRCESHHSLLTVPSKPGVFAIAEEIMSSDARVGTDPLVRPASQSEAKASPAIPAHVGAAASTIQRSVPSASELGTSMGERRVNEERRVNNVEERRFSAASGTAQDGALAPVVARRMLAVTQFFEDDDMAFVLDRMLSHENPMRARLASGRYFVRYVVIADATQRRSICNALNQWITSSAEKATGIGSHFASSLELPNAEPTHQPKGTAAANISNPMQSDARRVNSAPTLNSAVATNIHCSSSFPSGF